MEKVFFGTKKIQKLGRVQLTMALLDNLNLKEGNEVCIYLDVKNKQIIIKEGKK
jgi:bifunctional DNA-binding transcriptional regulator/antitoxin component of YhaV-PrlF toxin-antitoxin module